MSFLWFILIGLAGLLILGILALFATGNTHIFRGFKVVYLKGHTGAYIDDWPQFDNRVIEAASKTKRTAQKWKIAADYNSVEATPRLQQTHKKLGTIAFLIIKDDQIWYEDYAKNYGPTSKTNSYSMAKSITVALIGKAIDEGYLKGLQQPVRDFYPDYDPRVTIGHLAGMTSGMHWNEDYDNPFSSVARLYLVKDIREYMLEKKILVEPGSRFEYNSGNTQLLGMLLEKAVGKSPSAYLSEKFWQPMGMQEDALWELDSKEHGMEKTYCCIASNARDFSRFGKLFKDGGLWNGKSLLSGKFIRKCTQPSLPESPQYGHGFWLSQHLGKTIFAMRGILGQYVIVIPEDDLIITRLGHKRGLFKNKNPFTEDFYVYVEEAYKMLEKR